MLTTTTTTKKWSLQWYLLFQSQLLIILLRLTKSYFHISGEGDIFNVSYTFLSFFKWNSQRCWSSEHHTYTFNAYMNIYNIHIYISWILHICFFHLFYKSKRPGFEFGETSWDMLVSIHVDASRTLFYINIQILIYSPWLEYIWNDFKVLFK